MFYHFVGRSLRISLEIPLATWPLSIARARRLFPCVGNIFIAFSPLMYHHRHRRQMESCYIWLFVSWRETRVRARTPRQSPPPLTESWPRTLVRKHCGSCLHMHYATARITWTHTHTQQRSDTHGRRRTPNTDRENVLWMLGIVCGSYVGKCRACHELYNPHSGVNCIHNAPDRGDLCSLRTTGGVCVTRICDFFSFVWNDVRCASHTWTAWMVFTHSQHNTLCIEWAHMLVARIPCVKLCIYYNVHILL